MPLTSPQITELSQMQLNSSPNICDLSQIPLHSSPKSPNSPKIPLNSPKISDFYPDTSELLQGLPQSIALAAAGAQALLQLLGEPRREVKLHFTPARKRKGRDRCYATDVSAKPLSAAEVIGTCGNQLPHTCLGCSQHPKRKGGEKSSSRSHRQHFGRAFG